MAELEEGIEALIGVPQEVDVSSTMPFLVVDIALDRISQLARVGEETSGHQTWEQSVFTVAHEASNLVGIHGSEGASQNCTIAETPVFQLNLAKLIEYLEHVTSM